MLRISDFSFEISLTDEDPETAAEAVNTLIRAFQEMERQVPLRRHEARLEFTTTPVGDVPRP